MKVKNICMIPQHKLQLHENQYYLSHVMGSCIFRSLQVQTTCKQFAMQIAKLIEADGMETPPTYNLNLNCNIYNTT